MLKFKNIELFIKFWKLLNAPFRFHLFVAIVMYLKVSMCNTAPIVAIFRVELLRDTISMIGTTDARVACSFVFYSASFQLTSAKFQTFAYNSRTVWSSFMKFWQQFEINELYVSTKFRGGLPNSNSTTYFSTKWSRGLGFRTRKPPCKFGVKSDLSQKRLKYSKKYFIWLYVLRYPFIPTNPILVAMRFSFFLLFFSS